MDAWGRCVGDAAPKVRLSKVSTFLLLSAADCEVAVGTRFTAARFSDSSERDDVLPLCRRQCAACGVALKPADQLLNHATFVSSIGHVANTSSVLTMNRRSQLTIGPIFLLTGSRILLQKVSSNFT